MKILVTGGAGFIGSHLCEKLLGRGDTVVCVDNLNDYYDPLIKNANVESLEGNSNFTFYRADVRDYDALEKIFEKENFERVAHLAARAGVRPSIEQPLLYEEVNVKGTLNLLELSKKYKIENFVFASSSSVYGARKDVPFREADSVDNPISPYAASKKAGELFCYTYSHLYKIPMSCLRYFTVYGPRNRPDMAIYKFTKAVSEGEPIKVYGDGTSKRDYTYVEDIVDGTISAIDKQFDYEIFNLGNSNTVELNYLISLIEKNVGEEAEKETLPEQPGDVPITYADVSKAEKMLGYNPKVKIEEGIKRVVDWYKTTA